MCCIKSYSSVAKIKIPTLVERCQNRKGEVLKSIKNLFILVNKRAVWCRSNTVRIVVGTYAFESQLELEGMISVVFHVPSELFRVIYQVDLDR